MPSQSRGYWSCDFCGAEGFDTYDDAKAHEIEDCPHRKQPAESGRHEGAYRPAPHSIVPYGTYPMMDAPPEVGDYSEDPRYQMPTPYPRRLQLLMPGAPNDLSLSDAATCSSIEVMEATPDLVNAANVRRTERTMVSPGQVVLRCIQCVRNPSTVHGTPQIYPSSISSMASSVRLLQDHLRTCGMVHDEVKRAIGPSVAKGRRALEEDERDRHVLAEYCTNFCRREGIYNKHPPNSGIVFSEVEETFWTPPYGHSESRQGTQPPFSPYYPQPQRPGTEAGSDPTAATPVSSRRGRPQFAPDRGEGYQPAPYPFAPSTPYPPSASTAYPPVTSTPYPPSATYPPATPYQPSESGYQFHSPYTSRYGGPPRPERIQYSGRERSFGGETSLTPVRSSRFDQGPEYPPPQMEPSEGSPPRGYSQPYDVPPDFPFLQEPGGAWECRFCSHLHPQYRDPQSMWSVPGGAPPPGSFIDQHLSMCRAYNTPPPPPYPVPPTPYPFIPIHSQPQFPYGWDASGQPSGPPPDLQEHHPRPDVPPSLQPPPPHLHQPYQQLLPQPHLREHIPGHITDQPGLVPSRALGPIAPDASPADRDMERAKSFLAASDRATHGGPLVLEEDKLLLTDYFFHLMKQLTLCRFSESDRKTRGGKRDKIKIGYGGLQCVHCADTPNGRKFFWSNVDRLANSFAEIPGHLFKCRRCPQPLKDALLQLKGRHAEQMARLPRGSQKVFFRRMWRRLHDEDPLPAEGGEPASSGAQIEPQGLFSPGMEEAQEGGARGGEYDEGEADTPQHGYREATTSESSGRALLEREMAEGSQRKPPPLAARPAAATPAAVQTDSSPATSGSESVILLERTSQEAAVALASTDLEHPAPPSPSSRILLAIPEDKEWLSDMDCFTRRQVEVFCASGEDVLAARSDRKHPVAVGQIGIRCIHCALSKPRFGARGTAVAFPYSINGIFESVRELGRMHLESCENMPKPVKERLLSFKGSSSLSSVLRKYYVLAAKALGLYDTSEGIRAGAESIPLGPQAAFAFSPESTHISEQLRLDRGAPGSLSTQSGETTPLESSSRKRKQQAPSGRRSPKERRTKSEESDSPKRDEEPV